VVFRTEARGFTSKDAIFVKNDEFKKGKLFHHTSLAAWFWF
jgi:hypothetical protein